MNDITTFIQENQTTVFIVAAALVVLLLAWLAARRVRRHRRDAMIADDGPTIRRPVYADSTLLEELRAHAPTIGQGASEMGTATTTLGSSATTADAASRRAMATRQMNDTLDALTGTTVLNDLDGDPDRELEVGQAVLFSGTLERHAATDAVEILELAAPLLIRNRQAATDEDAGTLTVTPQTIDLDRPSGPVIVHVEHPTTKRGFLMVLRRDNLLVDDPTPGSDVTILAVVDRVIGRRETVEVDDYLAPHLTPAGREVLEERDLAETIGTLSEVAGEDLGQKDLKLRGPAAILTPAAIHR